MCALATETTFDSDLGGGLRTGRVHELYGLSNSGKTQLCIAHATSFLLGTQVAEVWWISSTACISSAAGRIAEILAATVDSSGGAAPPHLRRLRCFTCFDAHALMLLLRKAAASTTDASSGAGSRESIALVGRTVAPAAHESPFVPRPGPNLLLQAPFRLWKGAGCATCKSETCDLGDGRSCEGKKRSDAAAGASDAPAAKRRPVALDETSPAGEESSGGVADATGAAVPSRSLLTSEEPPLPHAVAATEAAGAAGAAAAAGSPSLPPSSCPVGLIIVDSIADILAPVAGGLKNFGSHALIGQVSRLLHAVATTGPGCAVLLTNNLVENRDRDKDKAGSASSAVAPALATSTPIGGHLLVPVAPAPRFKPALGAAWSAVPDVSIAVHGPVRLAAVQIPIAAADGAAGDVAASDLPAGAGADSRRGEPAGSSSAHGAVAAAAVAGKCSMLLPLPSAFTVTKGPAVGALLTKPMAL